jgi:hypothetical protein
MLDRGYFSHQIPSCNAYVWPAVTAAGVSWTGIGENIGWNNSDPSTSVTQMNTDFMNSLHHRDNILGDFNQVGLGIVKAAGAYPSNGTSYNNVIMYTQIFVKGPLPTFVAPPPTPTPPPGGPAVGGRFHPLVPARILDTRDGTGGAGGPLGPNSTMAFQVTGRGGVPATNVSGVVVNATVTNPTAPSFMTIWPHGAAQPTASNLNYNTGQTLPNLVQVAVGGGGMIDLYNQAGSTAVILDVAGYFDNPDTSPSPAGMMNPLVPARILDTRAGNGGFVAKVAAGGDIRLQVTGRGGVPVSGVTGVVLNLTATNPSNGTYVTAWPSLAAKPATSNLNAGAGQTIANRVVVAIDSTGTLTLSNAVGATDLIVDVNGWYGDATAPAGGSGFVGLTPVRIVDTRTGFGGFGRMSDGTTARVAVAGVAVPVGARTVVANITVTNTGGGGFITAFPSNVGRPNASDLNYGPGATVPNLAVVQIGSDGAILIANVGTSTDLVIDVVGYYS